MAVEWDDVRVFQSAVRAGDYTSAARKLGMDRTTVGRRLARLERAAGRSLWEEGSAGPRPTLAGRAVLQAAAAMERAMARLGDALVPAERQLVGPVRVAGTAGLAALLLPAFTGFLGRHPGIAIELVGARDAIAAVKQRQADLGFAIARSKPRDLAGHRIAGFAQRRYAAAGGGSDRPIGWGHAMMLANPQGWARLNEPGEGVRGLEVDGLGALHEAVRAGLGQAWLWQAIGDADAALTPFGEPAPAAAAADLWVIHRADLAVEPAVAALSDAAQAIVDTFLSERGA